MQPKPLPIDINMIRIRIPRTQWFNQPFAKNILANTLGTIIGIVLTIGTTYLVTNYEDRKSERQQVKMLVRSLDNHIEKFEGCIELMQESDSVNTIIKRNWDNLSVLADSTLAECVGRMIYFDNQVTDYTAAHIFESNIETWRTIRSVEFIETMGKCFTLSQSLTQYHNQLNEDKRRITMIYHKAELADFKTLKEMYIHILKESEVSYLIRMQHDLYIPLFMQGVEILKQKNMECKQLAGIAEDMAQS